MPSYIKKHHVNFSPQQMFDLVCDVEAYPEFLPMCESLTVRRRRRQDHREQIIADMTVAYKIVRETFTSDVRLDHTNLHVDVTYIDGPFRYLENRWRFNKVAEQGCEIVFDIDYEFRSKTLGLLMGTMFEIAFSKFSTAFEERAKLLYGDHALLS